jgi:hypothetical protein
MCGLFEIANFSRRGTWDEYQLWIALLIATAFVITGVGFIFGSTWARRVMAVLMVVVLLLFLDVLLMFSFNGNRERVWQVLVVIGVAGYTLLFLEFSAANRYKDSR